MKAPEETLSSVAARWVRIGQRVARMERSNQIQREMIARQKDRIQTLEEELLRARPTETKWGFLWWVLIRPEVTSVRIKTDAGQSHKYTRNAIYSNMASAWEHTGFDVSIHHVGGRIWDVSRGRS